MGWGRGLILIDLTQSDLSSRAGTGLLVPAGPPPEPLSETQGEEWRDAQAITVPVT